MAASHPIPRQVATMGGAALLLVILNLLQHPLPIDLVPEWILLFVYGFPFLAGCLLGFPGVLSVALAAIITIAIVPVAPSVAIVGMAAVMAEATAAVLLVRKGLPFSADFDHPKDVAFMVGMALTAALARALVCLLLGLAMGLPNPLLASQSMMALSTLAILICAPGAILWIRGSRLRKVTWMSAIEVVFTFGLAIVITCYFYIDFLSETISFSIPMLAVFLVMGYWIAFRFHSRGMSSIIPILMVFVLIGVHGRERSHTDVSPDVVALQQTAWMICMAAVVAFHLFIAASARNYRLREADREEWVRAARKQTDRLKEVNERLALQSLELADQTTELAMQRDEYQKLAREVIEKRTWLETVLAQLPVGILLIDKDTQTLSRNSRYEQTLGFGKDFPYGKLSDHPEWPLEHTDGSAIPYGEWPIIRAVREGVTTHDAELRLARHAGGWAEVAVNSAPIRSTEGSILGAVLVIHDVSQLRQAERAARDNEDRLRFALRSARMLAWEWDLDSNSVRRSDPLENWLGIPQMQLSLANSMHDRVHPDDMANLQKVFSDIRDGSLREFVIEYRLRHENGKYIWLESRGQIPPTVTGRSRTVVGVMVDITERKQSEERLRLLQSAVVHANDAVIVLEADANRDSGRRVLYVNDAFTRITGYSSDETLNRSLHYLRGPRTDTSTLDRLHSALVAHDSFACELLNYRKDGSEVWVDLSLVPVAGPDGRCQHFVMIQRDVTDRRRAEEAVRRSEERLRVLGDNVPNGAIYQFVRNLDGTVNVPYMSAGVELMTEVPASEIMKDPDILFRHVHPEDMQWFIPQMLQSAEQMTPFNHEFRFYTRSRELRWAHCQSMPSRQSDGTTVWNGVMLDITARKRVEAALRESEQLFRGMFETTSAGVSIVGPDGTFTACNPAFSEMLGRPQSEILGHRAETFSHPEDWAIQSPFFYELLEGKRDQYQIRKRYIRPNGKYISTELSTTAIRGSRGEFLYSLGVSVDITSRQSLEEQLRQSQKMEALGQLAGGIAHDFNNLLTAVIGNLGLVKLPEDSPAKPLLRAVEQAATRAADLTRKLLGYARRNQLLVAPILPSEMFGEVVDILRRTLDPRIRIQVDVRADDILTADATLINQALFNLCLNARDAMPEGGTMTLSSDLVTITPERVTQTSRVGTFIRLSVVDTGVGMNREVQDRLFEPFFTTKGVGKGTGLGLPMVHGIMTQHQGWVNFESEPGNGSRFELYLPVNCGSTSCLLRRSCGDSIEDTVPFSNINTTCDMMDTILEEERACKVLLVDDESMIRNLARAILEQAGHTVIEAEDGVEAVDIYSRESSNIDLIILDLTMPRLSGRDAFSRIVEINPHARVLFSSGYSADDLSATDGVRGLLSKPYRPADLVAAVRRAMSQDATAV